MIHPKYDTPGPQGEVAVGDGLAVTVFESGERVPFIPASTGPVMTIGADNRLYPLGENWSTG
jgi:hypothetical protein